MKYFTSDTHFFHENIIKFCNRPFDNIKDMGQVLINNWNDIVGKDDEVYHLGDFAFTGNIKAIKTLKESLNGKIHLILGNHDYQNKLNRPIFKEIFDSVQDYLYIQIDDDEMEGGWQGIVLSHYPMLTWHQALRGSWQLFGHIHLGPYAIGQDKNLPLKPNQYDVGVDNNNYFPVSYDEVKIIITKQYLGHNDMKQFANN